MKKSLVIVSALLFFALIGYGLKYVHDLSFSGNDEIKIVSDYKEILNLEELLNNKAFSNKVVYIDIWGTKCSPCIAEFKHLPKLKKRYKDQNVEFVYLASPYGHIDDKQKWKSGLKKYNLQGHNVLMNMDFYTDIWKEVPEMKDPFVIPHYLIINKDGKIVNPNAPSPSDDELLYAEIDKLL